MLSSLNGFLLTDTDTRGSVRISRSRPHLLLLLLLLSLSPFLFFLLLFFSFFLSFRLPSSRSSFSAVLHCSRSINERRTERVLFFSRFRFFAVAVAVAVVVVVVVVVVERMDFRWHSSAARATTAVGATPQKRSNRS